MRLSSLQLIIISIFIVAVGGYLGWELLPKTYQANGIRFSIARKLAVEEIPSTDGNYKNFRLEKGNSNLTIHVPLGVSVPANDLATIMQAYGATTAITTEQIAGHTAQVARFQSKGSLSGGTGGEQSEITIVSFTSRIPSSPILVSLQRFKHDTALNDSFDQVLSSLQW